MPESGPAPEPRATSFHTAPGSSGAPAHPNSILSETLLQNDETKVVMFRFAAGQELSEHTAAVAALLHQISGRARWGLGAESREVDAGDWAFMPANLKHSILALEDAVLLLILLKKSKG